MMLPNAPVPPTQKIANEAMAAPKQMPLASKRPLRKPGTCAARCARWTKRRKACRCRLRPLPQWERCEGRWPRSIRRSA
jgi:hypothetical protein